MIGTASFS